MLLPGILSEAEGRAPDPGPSSGMSAPTSAVSSCSPFGSSERALLVPVAAGTIERRGEENSNVRKEGEMKMDEKWEDKEKGRGKGKGESVQRGS